jgi:hypothetical protein
MTNRKTAQNPTILPPDERLRLEAAERLGAMMALSLRLLDDSGVYAALGKSDAVGALNAAARLIKSNADVTHALVRAAQGETRHRSIAQQISLGAPGLNPNFLGTPRPSHEETEETRRRLAERINRMIDLRKSQGLPVGDEDGTGDGKIHLDDDDQSE